MIAELGVFAVVLAMLLAVLQSAVGALGAVYEQPLWVRFAAAAAYKQFVFLLIAFVCLAAAFVADDFSVAYIATHSNTAMPLIYKVSAVWGGHEGSLLLWCLMLAAWTAVFAATARTLPPALAATVLAVLGVLSFCFVLFTLATSNPFERLALAPAQGRELNPLLQDIGLAIHPPMLYMGYVGFSVAFAFALAALLLGRMDAQWAQWARPWTAAAWIFLTIGIGLGSWWAYYELGWGGWWFWDPVENASFMPWLTGTALLHSLAATQARGVFRAWTALLAILTFSLCLLGTFIVRSGVLVSVHSFASDPQRGVLILLFLAVVVGASLLLFGLRMHRFKSALPTNVVSKDSALLLNNVFLGTALVTVLLGTLYPLVLDALGANKISVGVPYYNRVFVPLMLPLLLLVGFGAYARWKHDTMTRLIKSLSPLLVTAVAVGMLLPLLLPRYETLAAVGLSLAMWIFLVSVRQLADFILVRRRPALSLVGMVCAHIGLAVFVAGATMAGIYGAEKDVRLSFGERHTLGAYDFLLVGVEEKEVDNYRTQWGTVVVRRGDEEVTVHPEKRFYVSQEQPLTEAGIDAGLWRDIYVSLGEELSAADASSGGGAAWSVRLQVKPLMRWVWGGVLLMALGALLGIIGRKKSAKKAAANKNVSAKSAAEKPAGDGAVQ